MDTSAVSLGLGALIGLVMTLTGAGGGILGVPALVFGLHLPVQQAAPVGLIAVGASAALSAYLGWREGTLRYRAAGLIGVTGMLVAPAGVWLATQLPSGPLTIAFALVLLGVAWRMYRQTQANDAPACSPDLPCVLNPQEGRLIWTLPCAWALVTTGVMSGLLSGLLGVGGGFVIIPALTRYTNLNARSIVTTSLAVIALVSVGGVGAAAWQGSIQWPIAIPFALGAVGVVPAGRALARRLPARRLQQAFAVTCVLVAGLLVARAL